ncbi:hypothetical protein CAPTEDRAFT_161465 [Capitella teleta]|uniref:C-type lectin domain-containing protein n=1 Tax=Capitella teleta TaxID=283909 RepID=R7TQV8_CAPTE|nr:hypothetical protein CAPTEDRAFT_161465 [Capitella teleta]|eukprot:ELT93866.1 hypothetical protein CAPTEDRAFT_161465 [Capitella teleta]
MLAGVLQGNIHHDSGCPRPFERHLSSCYHFSNQTKHWVDAERTCQSLHPEAHLVAMETSDEEKFVIQYRLHNNADWSSRYVWIGATDTQMEGHWHWVGSGKELSHAHWREGQPNNQKGRQHCAYMTDLYWDDWGCREAEMNFVCEI